MPTSINATQLPTQIQQLLSQRQQHTDAITKIDKTLAGVMAALGGTTTLAAPKALPTAAKPVVSKAPAQPKKRQRGSYAVSATDLVLTFLKGKPATTKEITDYIVGQGRSTGAVSNALSVLTKAKKLKRTPLGKGVLGSTYALA